MLNPATYMMKNEPISDTGMSISGRSAMSQSRKNRKMMRMTSANAMMSVWHTSAMECLTNRVLSITASTCRSLGSSFLIRSKRL